MKIRTCSVAGMFYPRDPHHLEQLLTRYFHGKDPGVDAKAVVSPHAGYPYSGDVAGWSYSAIDPSFSGSFIIIGPSHRGYQTCISGLPWETPLGIVDNDTELGSALDLETDELSHRDEHSIEVQVPFIKYRFPRARIVPVMMGAQDYGSAAMLSEKILDAIRERGSTEVRLVASSDFSHYVPQERARANDLYAIDALSTLDCEEFYQRIAQRQVSACGFGPITAACLAGRGLGATKGTLLRYATSGDVTGDPTVVGYAAIAVI